MTSAELAASRSKEAKAKQVAANKQEVIDAVNAKFGDKPLVAAALIGNIDVETGGSFSFSQKQKGGPAEGLFQFEHGKYGNGTNKHFDQYSNWLKSNKLSNGAAAQVAYVYDTIYGSNQKYIGAGNAKNIRAKLESSDPIEVTKAFASDFLRPNPQKAHLDKRVASASSYLASLKNAKPEPEPAPVVKQAPVFKAPVVSATPAPLPAPIIGQPMQPMITFPYPRP